MIYLFRRIIRLTRSKEAGDKKGAVLESRISVLRSKDEVKLTLTLVAKSSRENED